MRIIVDANIVFSGILNSEGKIGDLLINSDKFFVFVAPYFLKTEINKYYPRLVKISGMTLEDIKESESQVCKAIKFISPEQILSAHWITAENHVSDIDPQGYSIRSVFKTFSL